MSPPISSSQLACQYLADVVKTNQSNAALGNSKRRIFRFDPCPSVFQFSTIPPAAKNHNKNINSRNDTDNSSDINDSYRGDADENSGKPWRLDRRKLKEGCLQGVNQHQDLASFLETARPPHFVAPLAKPASILSASAFSSLATLSLLHDGVHR